MQMWGWVTQCEWGEDDLGERMNFQIGEEMDDKRS